MKKTILLFAVIGALIASIALFAGIKHNSMGEFCIGGDLDNCRLDLLYAAQLWFFWFAPLFLIQTGLFFAVKLLVSRIKKLTIKFSGPKGPGR
jgi:hypothetical protein